MKKIPTIIVVASYALSSAHAAEIANPGFETDPAFTNFFGYISANSPITGWTANDDNRAGLNESGGPFHDNGTIPEGAQVAFLQGDASGVKTLGSTSGITGLTSGLTYNLTYRVNNRNFDNNGGSTMGLVLNGATVLENKVTPTNGDYRYVSYNFVAPGATVPLVIENRSLSDKTLLLDSFVVTEVTPKITVSAWTDDASSGISNSLVYTHAYNLGNSESPTVNGVAFIAAGGGNPSVSGSFSYSMPAGGLGDSNNLTSGTGGSALLAQDFVFGSGDPTLTLEGLVAGQTYRTTLFAVGWDATGGRVATIIAPGGEKLSVDVNAFGENNGVRVDVEFTASATTEQIKVVSLDSTAGFHTYAFANAWLSAPTMITVDSITTAPGTISGKQVTVAYTSAQAVDVYASIDLVNWDSIATNVTASPFVEDNVPDTKRFYVMVMAGVPYPPAQ